MKFRKNTFKVLFLALFLLPSLCIITLTDVQAQTKKTPNNTIKTTPSVIEINNKTNNTTTSGGIIVDPGKNKDDNKKPNTPKPNKPQSYIPSNVNYSSSILVINAPQTTSIAIYSKPSTKSKKIGTMYGSLAEIKLIKNNGKFSLIEGVDYESTRLIRGYIPTYMIKKVNVRKDYIVVVDISEQRVYVYKNGKIYKKIACSTGINSTPTPIGRFLVGVRGNFFYFKNVRADNWVRFNYNYMFHSVLYSKETGELLTSAVKKLGNKASHGCIRLSVNDSKWFYSTIPSGTMIIVQK